MRPTSEAIIWSTYGRWLQSYRDLPLLYNQWANVVRWELRPRLFLRTTEFLWQEGHTAHETEQEAVAECLRILHEVYADTQRSVLAMPALLGRKSAAERFPGARETFTAEAMMGDRKALQAATSHYLGDEFARAYGVTYTGRDGAEHHPFATSWGASSRLVGGGDHDARRRARAAAATGGCAAPGGGDPDPAWGGTGAGAGARAGGRAAGGGHPGEAGRPRPRPSRRKVLRVGAEGRA